MLNCRCIKWCFITLSIICIWTISSYAQIIHPKNIDSRLNIDAKAVVTSTRSKEALARGLEFQEIDSTYFLGYMYEGIYKVRHAQDLIGYKIATEPLEKAYDLIVKDYRTAITKRSTDVFDVYYNYQIQMYFQELVYNLWEAYMNAQEFQKAYDLTLEVAHFNLQMEFYFQSYTHLAWIVHKLRVFNSQDYPFLKDDVYSNVHLAMQYLDSAHDKAEKDQRINEGLLGDMYTENVYGIAHYQAILHTYLFQMDSATFYYDMLKNRGFYSHGNRGNFLYVMGKFQQAEEEYTLANKAYSDEMSKELKEQIYYTSFIEINKKAKTSYISELLEVLKSQQSKPGYGWYNMAMARTLLYSGMVEESKYYLDKAENFKELHIGTTLGNEHYQLSLQTLKYLYAKYALIEYKNNHEGWYWNPWNWIKVAGLWFESYVNKFALMNVVSANPEREQVLYAIFASESVLYWNDVVDIIKEINPKFFSEYYLNQINQNDQRPAIIPYQRLMLAQNYIARRMWSEAHEQLELILDDPQIDVSYEQHLLAQTLALESLVQKKLGQDKIADKLYFKMYALYPSLALRNKGELKFHISNTSPIPSDVFKYFNKSPHRLVKEIDDYTAIITLEYAQKNKMHYAKLTISDAQANIIINEVELNADDMEDLAWQVYRACFGYIPLITLKNDTTSEA